MHNQVSFDDFSSIYRALLNQQKLQSEALTEVFNQSLLAQGGDRKQGLMGFDSFKSFLSKVQHESLDEDGEIVQRMMQHRFWSDQIYLETALNQSPISFSFCSRKRFPSSEKPHLTFSDFLNYLYSPQNDVLDPKVHQVNMDQMNEPLSHYFINSSHNSYLTGI